MHVKNLKISKGTCQYTMTQSPSMEFGFNILTEHIKSNKDEDSPGYTQDTTNQNKPFTDDAIILQSILEYGITFGTERYFTSRELSQTHLLDKCRYYRNLYQGSNCNKGARIEHMNKRVVESLKKLVYLELVNSEQYESTNKRMTEKYAFTEFGRLIGLILFYINSNTIGLDTYEAIFSQMCSFYKTMSHAHARLCLIFFYGCYFENKLHIVIYYVVRLLEDATDDKHSFLNQVRFLNIIFRDLDMWEIYKTSLNILRECDPHKHLIVLYNLKLTIEEIHEFKSRHLREFEIGRLQKIQDIDESVIEGGCNSCGGFVIVSMNTISYLESYITSVVSGKYVFDIKCNSCGNDYLDFQSFL
jgi:hypothetical protein